MGCGATTVGHENRDTADVDRYPEEGLSLPQDVSANQCAQAAGDGTNVSAAELSNDKANETEATAQIGQTEVFRMVCNHQPVKRADELDALARARNHLVTESELIGRPRIEHIAKEPGIHRVGSVKVSVAPVDPRRHMAVNKG